MSERKWVRQFSEEEIAAMREANTTAINANLTRPAAPVERGEVGVVREALVRVFRAAPKQTAYLAYEIRCEDLNVYRVADALLALRATPAPSGEAEPVAWACVEIGVANAIARAIHQGLVYATMDECSRQVRYFNEKVQDYTLCPLYRATPPSVPQVTEEMVERGVNAWIEKINESHSLARMEAEMGRGEIVRHILTAALTPQPKEGDK